MERTNSTVDLNKYKVWILDFDGTLYYQFPVRLVMGMWLSLYYFLHPWRIKEFLIILEYRSLRENLSGRTFWKEDLSDVLIKKLCSKFHVVPEEVNNIVKIWLETKPFPFIHQCQRKKLIRIIQEYQRKNVLMVVYSDNPLKEKIKAVSFVPDYFFDCDHNLIKCLKPNVQGLNNIIMWLGEKKEDVLYIGDRDDRDSVCAKNAGLCYIDVNDFEKLLK